MQLQAQLFDECGSEFIQIEATSTANQLRIAARSPTVRMEFFGSEERSVNMLFLLAILVVAVHLLIIIRYLVEPEAIVPPKPMIMSVSMISLPPKPQVQPPQPQPQPMKPEPKPAPKKQVLKPVPKPVIKPLEPAPQLAQETSVTNAAIVPTSVSAPAPTLEKAEPLIVTEPNYRANYATNPRPTYPSIARNHGWQGKVALHVQVTVDGLAASVRIERSSGYEVLDEAALEAVKQWRFIPAKQGDKAIASSVVVPLSFTLHEE